MEILGLDVVIWGVLALYFAGMLLLGWWSKRSVHDSEGFLLGNRKFGVSMMVMHAFGAGTNPGDAAGSISKSVETGASGIWVSWMWMFGTPIYWLIAPVVRRMRCLTMSDFYRERYSRSAAVLFTIVSSVAMMVFFAGVLLATTRTVQGMMGKAALAAGSDGIDWWFYGILITTTVTFTLYGYWGGIVAAIRTDMVQGLMIIVLSFLAIPAAFNLPEIGGLAGLREALAGASTEGKNYLNLFDPKEFNLTTVILLCINAPLTALAFPHLMTVCAAGRTEWEGRMGFTAGNMLKRFCSIGWTLLGLCWLAHLLETGAEIHPNAAFGDSIRALLSPALQGIMLACVMAASMSSGDAFQVTVAGLFTQSIYREYINPDANEESLVRFTRVTGAVIVALSLGIAIAMQGDFVASILAYCNLLAIMGISTAMGILWRRMNTTGVFTATLLGSAAFMLVRYFEMQPEYNVPAAVKWSLPIVVGIAGGIVGSLATAPPDPKVIETFFKKIYVPIGQEARLAEPLDKAVPPASRLLTAGGLFIVKPSRESWVGFVVTLAICLGCVAAMLAMLNG